MTAGLVLAAGAGSRMGRPKALMRDPDGTGWLARAVAALVDGGCDPVTVVLGAAAAQARVLVPDGASVVVADDWASGMAASLRAGLTALDPASEAVVVTLVDLPDVGPDVVRRVADGAGPATLARAAYAGTPGHPVVLGRVHWAGVAATATGDAGAKSYLTTHHARVVLVECGDLATGVDQDSR